MIARIVVGVLAVACAVPAAVALAAGVQGYSSLAQITPGDVHSLAGAWVDHLEGGASNAAQESTPVAVGGRLYVQSSQGDVFAVDGATGNVIWEYRSGLAGIERGVAVAAGRVFAALGHQHVVALNQQTGAVIWQAQVGTPGQDTAANGSATPWTLYFRGLVYVGTENGGGAGMRGHLYALRASDGTVAWSFAGTAGPGQPGHSSWKGTSWMLGGGDVWMAPAVDPKLGTLYIAVANPEPRVSGAARAGNDLYTNSLVALNAATGKLDWYFQSVHHDLWDYDNTMTPLVASVRYPGGAQQVVIYGSKSGWLYYLNAKTGKPALPVRNKAVPGLASQATSATQPIPAGQPLVPTCPQKTGPTRPIPDYRSGCEFTPYLHSPVLVTPGGAGGANWAPMSLDPQTGLLYVPAAEFDFAYSDGLPYGQPTFWKPEGEFRGGVLDAVDPRTNKIAWQVRTPYGLSNGDGVLTTSTGLLFEGAPDGIASARSAANGKILWNWQTGAGIETTPVTYTANGAQYVAVFAGGNTAYNSSFGDGLWAFKLHGTVPPGKAPATIPARVPVGGATIAGDTVSDTVVMGRTWDTATGSPSPAENLASQVAMAPAIMTVPAGTTVTFTNPPGNLHSHCAESFFDPANFKIGPLAPGHSGTYRFVKPGGYFYNDCAGFPWNTGEIIVQLATVKERSTPPRRRGADCTWPTRPRSPPARAVGHIPDPSACHAARFRLTASRWVRLPQFRPSVASDDMALGLRSCVCVRSRSISPVDIDALRAQTPGCARRIHLNNAGAALLAQPTLDAMTAQLRREAEIGGYEAAAEARDAIAATYDAIAELVGGRREEVALFDNATHAWNAAFYSVPLGPGDQILTGRAEYGSNVLAYWQAARRAGADVVVVPNDEHGQLDVAALERLAGERTRLIGVSHVPTSGGLVQPVAEIGRIARGCGALYLLDATQSAGQFPVDVDVIGCDLLAGTGRKFLRGPRGTGFLWVRDAAVQRLDPFVAEIGSATWDGQHGFTWAPGAQRFATWEHSYVNVLGLGAAVRQALDLGLAAIGQRAAALGARLRGHLAALPGVTVHDLGQLRCAIVTAKVDGVGAEQAAGALRRAGVNVSTTVPEDNPLDTQDRGVHPLIRFSPHYYNTEEEVDRTSELVAALAWQSV